jgi:HAD superfamily hydrolase (TIGR01509 family)
LTRMVVESEPANKAASGEVAECDVWQSVGRRLSLNDEQASALQRDFWAGEELDEALVRYLQSLRPAYKIGILSNAWSEARAFHNARFKFDTWVDAAVYSAEVKLLKPDPRIYRLALATLNLPAAECIFVDDKRTNVEAAQRLGMQGVWYRETQQAIADIQSCLSS